MASDTSKTKESAGKAGGDDETAAAALVAEECQIPSLPLVLRTLDNLGVKANGAEIGEKEITDEIQKACPIWSCRRNEAQRLIRELLEEGEMGSKCHSSPTKLGFWKFGKRPDDQVRVDQEEVDVAKTAAFQLTDGVRTQPTICQDCHEKNKDLSHVSGEDSLNSKEIMALITKTLKNDELGTNDVHCLCNKCLDIKSDFHLQAKCRRQMSGIERSAIVEKNMELLRRHHQRKSQQESLYKSEKEKRKKKSKKKKRKSKSKKSSKSGKSGKKAAKVAQDEIITKEAIEIATFKEQQGITTPEPKIAAAQESKPLQADVQTPSIPDFDVTKPWDGQAPRAPEPAQPKSAEVPPVAESKEGGSSKSKKKKRGKQSETPSVGSEKKKRRKKKKKKEQQEQKSGKKDAAVAADLAEQPQPAVKIIAADDGDAGGPSTPAAPPFQPTAADEMAERAPDSQKGKEGKSKKKRRKGKKSKKKEN